MTVDIMIKSKYWITRIIFLRSLAFIYIASFLAAKLQNIQLIGYHGLTPADIFMEQYKNSWNLSNSFSLFLKLPTILWFLPINRYTLNLYLDAISWLGLILSIFVFISGKANMLIMFCLWLLYLSIINVGQNWYSFGWESQLLETGFIAIFMCNLISLKMFSISNLPSFIPIFLNRWLIFRIMIGSGLIKLRGDQCWHDLTCMNYHYETQPVPNPIAYYLHMSPPIIHKIETFMNHLVEIFAPWLILLPQPLCAFGGLIQILFQIILIISGNLAFLNWLSIIPCICCFEDCHFKWLIMRTKYLRFFNINVFKNVNNLADHENISEKNTSQHPSRRYLRYIVRLTNYVQNIFESMKTTKIIHWLLLATVMILSVAVVKNLVSPNQVMNKSFDSFRIVNTYGYFGSITKLRTEVILEGTMAINPYSETTPWKEYHFNCKPGDVHRRPCFISPYHYRLDWSMWFAAFQNPNHNIWLYHLMYKFLKNDIVADELIFSNPFRSDFSVPKWIRASHYRYKFRQFGDPNSNSSQWWTREYIGSYIQPLDLKSLDYASQKFQWDR